tara:strand:+ start:9288 stop:10283 length:996 start_codon:yes stop_codon:yes gene_type:complete
LKNNIQKSRSKKYCFIGHGSIAKKHINILSKLNKNNQIIILENLNIKKKNNFKNIIYLSFKELQNVILDAIFITNPASMHYSWLKKVYKLNTNIFIEKPIFDKNYNINKIISHQKKIKKKIKVGYMFRYDPLFIYLKKLIDNFSIGELKIINIYCGSDLNKWRINQNLNSSISLKKDLGGGVLRELSHEIDYLLWIFGDFEVSISKLINSGRFKNSDVFDKADILFKKKSSDLLSLMHLNFNQKKTERYCIVIGNNGTIKANILKREIILEKKGKKIKKRFCNINEVYKKQMISFIKPSINKNEYEELSSSVDVIKYINKIEKKNNLSTNF